jgi:hypothetical protein
MSNKKKVLFDPKVFFKIAISGLGLLSVIGLCAFTKYSSYTKGQLLEQNSGNSFAILECSVGSCESGTYIDLSATKKSGQAPQVTSLGEMQLESISKALSRSNIPYKFSGQLALFEVGKCNHMLRDSAETFYALEFEPINELMTMPPLGKSCDDVDQEGPCRMRVRLMDVAQNNFSYKINNSLNRLSYYSSSILWTWL